MRTARFGRTDVRKSNTRGLSLERLEPRMLLAVSVTEQGSTCVIRGNGDDDEVFISRDNSDIIVEHNGEVDECSGVRNIDVDLGGGDDLLGIAQEEAGLADLAAFFDEVEPGVDPDPIDLDEIPETDPTFIAGFLRIRMGTGDDQVGLAVDTGLHVDINTGSGLDQVGVLDSDIGTHLFVRGDRNDDQVGVFRSSVGTTLLIDVGDGNDLVLVQELVAARQVTMIGGTGNDGMTLVSYDVRHSVVLLGGKGNDEIDAEFGESSYLQINGDDGDDDLDADGVLVFGTLLILGGNGEDDVDVGPNDEFPLDDGGERIAEIQGVLVIDVGAGDDVVDIETLDARSITIIAGSGDDEVVVDDVVAIDLILILMGAGEEDVLEFFDNEANRIILDGGSGNNDTIFTDEVGRRRTRIRNFENVNPDLGG